MIIRKPGLGKVQRRTQPVQQTMQRLRKTDEQSDAKGVRLASLAAAKCETAKVVASAICAAANDVWRNSQWIVTVTNDLGVKLLEFQVVGTEVMDS